MQKVEVAIIGAGPAGLTAGIYLGRARINAVLFEKAGVGGQMGISECVENYPGFTEGISGFGLAQKMRLQAEKFGAKIIEDEVVRMEVRKRFRVKTVDNKEYEATAVIIATGARPAQLNVPGEEEFAGRGVSYCATCDGPLFKGKDVAVVGGGDTAVQEAIYLGKFANKVYLIHRRGKLRATKILQERVRSCKAIQPLLNSVVLEIQGEKSVESVRVKDLKKDDVREIDCSGVFIFAGYLPCSELVKDFVKTDAKGFIITGEDMKTSVDGIFACGDVRKRPLRQVVTACGEGATAAVSAQHYIEEQRGEAYI